MNQWSALPVSVLLLSLTLASPVSGDWISERELQESCRHLLSENEPGEGRLCRAYFQGFILAGELLVGAETGSVAATGPDASTSSGKETFSERATRTRVSSERLRQVQGSSDSGYCIDENTPVSDIIQAVAEHIESDPGASDMTNPDTVREALTRRFPCDV